MTTDSLETKTTPPSDAASPKPAPRPRLGLRIGVTGHRRLNADLREQVREVLALIWQDMKDLAREEAVAKFYASADGVGIPMMRLLSPLASGADRLVAEVALDLGYTLYVPMPFVRDQYETDFKHPEASPLSADDDDLNQFEKLFERAGEDWLALDGDPEGRNRTYAYENVGRFVVRHSDVLIAIWDGKPAAGRGGTAEIVYYAATNGIPVWWIHATDESKPAVWIADVEDLCDPLPPAESPKDRLKSYLNRQIRPPGPVRTRPHSLFEKVAHLGKDPNVAPEMEYYAEQPRPVARYWRVYNWLMRWASGCNPPWTEARRPKDNVAAYWFDLYDPADERAGEYAKRYRSTYVWIFILATLGLLFGVVANVAHARFDTAAVTNPDGRQEAVVFFWVFLEKAETFLELVLLVLIFGLVTVALRRDWHRRSIEYRLLAELCRKQQVLAPLGNAVSLGAVRQIVNRLDSDLGRIKSAGEVSSAGGPNRATWVVRLFAARQRVAELYRKRQVLAPLGNAVSSGAARQSANKLPPAGGPDHAAWVAWLFAACQRVAPLPCGDVEKLLPEAVDKGLVEGLIEEQLQYHHGRREMAGEADKTFESYGGLSFLAVIGSVILKLFAIWLNWGSFWELLFGSFVVAFAAVSAAFVGIRSYAELQLLAEQSYHMLDELEQAKARVERIRRDVPRPMAFHDLGAEAQTVAILMLQDLEGWARLFRGKAIEP